MVDRLTANEAIVVCAQDLLARLDDVTVHLSKQLAGSVPEFFEDEDLVREVEASAYGNVASMLSVFRAENSAEDVPIRAEVTAFATAVARRQIPLESLIQAYRVGQTLFSRLWMDALAGHIADQDVFIAALHRSFDELNIYLDRVVAQLVGDYERERERWLRGEAARRTALVGRLLRGDRIPIDHASRQLDHDLRAPQTALVAWTASHGEVDLQLAALETRLNSIASAAGVARMLMLPAGTCTMWAWIAGNFDAEQLSDGDANRGGPEVLVAAGQTIHGDDAFRISHEQALRARHVASHMTSPAPLTLHADVATVALLANDYDEARRFVSRTLGNLAYRTTVAAQLRETLRVFLQEGGNTRQASERLFMHRNTVLYRLRRAEELIGVPLAKRRLAVEVALLFIDTFGDEMLPPASPFDAQSGAEADEPAISPIEPV
ncbi:PucR family transcriptional regulator [[Mycobacterium] crassicus]|uniref:Helix-turn-helix domain-containing protein n=1 Tax=[Mycobacterium] crassicus TaxID=2872309 RepID=A0ABU5XGD5_9MYCO|nr:helix-turn-helix domain-containing protein [Mycolicibacter sp. MYC098]MEB3020862.1 helix-turn-helix domain-containing protein [Mycolicibacter sp. MYC098]